MVAAPCSVWPGIFRHAGIYSSAIVIGLASGGVALGGEGTHVAPVINFINTNVRGWITDPIIIQALKAQNTANGHLTKTDIDALDSEWVSETNSSTRPMIDKAMATPLSHFLREKQEEALGSITEVVVMDAKGLNAGQSSVTTDYWQGDEDKFIKSFDKGPGAVFVDDARKDASTQMLQSQVSMTIVDETDKPIGAITIGINLDQL